MEKFKYIEIVRDNGNVVVKRIHVTGSGERSINRVERGVNINLNHNEFTTRVEEYDQKMPDSDEKKEEVK